MSIGEFDIIAKYFAPRGARGDVLLGIGDDAAILDVRSDRKLVLAMDTIVAGVHFLADARAADIGYRALAVNLSDLAAMGAEPSWMSLSLSMPEADENWLADFAGGLFELADEHAVALVGGDTVRGPLVVTVQVGGWVEAGRWLTRSGAREGDVVFVSGVPGEAAAGLALLRDERDGGADGLYLQQRFLRPAPRIRLGRALSGIAHAAMDVSDGLLTDLTKLCSASGCGARLDVDALPESAAMSALFTEEDRLRFALCGGDDYELLFTAPASAASRFANGVLGDTAVRQIGQVTRELGVRCVRKGEHFSPPCAGYDHFA
jgi:thiamine-monophosphate kinase